MFKADNKPTSGNARLMRYIVNVVGLRRKPNESIFGDPVARLRVLFRDTWKNSSQRNVGVRCALVFAAQSISAKMLSSWATQPVTIPALGAQPVTTYAVRGQLPARPSVQLLQAEYPDPIVLSRQ